MGSEANKLDLDDRPKIENCATGEFAGTFNIEIGGPGSMGDDKANIGGENDCRVDGDGKPRPTVSGSTPGILLGGSDADTEGFEKSLKLLREVTPNGGSTSKIYLAVRPR